MTASNILSDSHYSSRIITIERFILEEQRLQNPDATGVLTGILYDIALAAKFISARATRANLTEILGSPAGVNGHDKSVDAFPPETTAQKLHRFAERTIQRLNDHTGRLAVMASEEQPHMIPIPERYEVGKYALLYDPLDGTSNIDYNVSIGTIFGIYERRTESGPGKLEDLLQKGRKLAAAGYIIYGSGTMMVYSTGQGVHGFTLDPAIGEFLLSHPHIRMPEKPRYYSANQGYYHSWSEEVRHYTEWLQGERGNQHPLSLRYVGSLVADFHRNLMAGGVFYYPRNVKETEREDGKLRLTYEAAPLAFLAEQAGGYASDGTQPILDIEPTTLHQRTPLFIGNRDLVEKAEEFHAIKEEQIG